MGENKELHDGSIVSSAIFIVIKVRDQKLVRWREYYDEATALKAAGLEG
jgi:limonene-1,2-epoxide hydrolase